MQRREHFNMDKIKKFFELTIAYCKENPFHLATVIGLFALLFVLLAVMIVISNKPQPSTKEKPQETEKKAVNTQVATAIEPVVEKEKTEEKEEKQPSPAPVTAPVEVAVEEPVKQEEPSSLHEQLKDVDTNANFYEDGEADQMGRYRGKWVICRIVTEDNSDEETYFFELHASNGEKLLSSEEYTTYNGALRGIETHKANILKGNFRITLSKKGDYIFKLLSGKNMLLCLGEHYATKARCESAIESAKRFARTAVIDENVQDQVVKVPTETDEPVQPLPEGYNGKWVIQCSTSPDGEKVYYFELFANNGERLLSSEEYTTYIGAVNGIQTHKMNIQKGNFRINLTKKGDYIYKLLNSNNQLLCLGEHYKTRRLCQNAVESVKRFAINSPVLTDPKLTK